MNNENNTIQDEQKIPTKEELIAFFEEQIAVKKVQLELQELNTALAVGKAEELKALAFIGQLTNPRQQEETYTHTVTKEDIKNNPGLTEQGIKEGDQVELPLHPEQDPKVRTLKKSEVSHYD